MSAGQDTIEGSRVQSTAGPAAELVARQLTTQPIKANVPKYRYSRTNPTNTGNNAFSINAGSTADVVLEVSIKPVNLSKSVLSYTKTTADQGVGRVTWDHADTLGELQAVQLATRGGQNLVDVNNYANVMLKVMASKESKLSEVQGEDAASLLRISDLPAPLNVTTSVGLGTMHASRNTLEKQYMRYGPVGNNAGTGVLERKVDFLLGKFLNTFLTVDKDILFPEIIYLRLIFAANKAGFSSTSNNDPTLNSQNLVDGFVTANINTCVYLSSMYLYLAIEQRPDLQKEMFTKMDAGHVREIKTPFVKVFRTNPSGANVFVGQQMDPSWGKTLRKVTTAVFPANETAHRMFDQSNLPESTDTKLSGRVAVFQTTLDEENLQEYQMSSSMAVSHDWLEQKEMLKGSMINGKHQYYRNWSYTDSWIPESPERGMVGTDVLGGVDLARQRKYNFVALQMADVAGGGQFAGSWYQIYVTTKTVRIAKDEVTIK